jgi:sugar phosphate isomerase/epimerase
MGYVVGVSSGLFLAASQEEKPNFLTVPRKIFRGGLEGVNFTQLDIESITEFVEPYLEEEVKKIRKLGIRFGVHGESYAMGGNEKPIGMLDSAIEAEYEHAHTRLMQHIDGCGKIKAEYVNIHPSETVPFIRLGLHLQPVRLVDFWGRSLKNFLKENTKVLEWLTEALEENIVRVTHLSNYVYNQYQRKVRSLNKNVNDLTEEERSKLEKEATKEAILELVESQDLEYGSERIAYFAIAKWMQDINDPLWKSIVGKKIPDDKLPEKVEKWVPAVSAKYIWGHFNPINTKKYKDPKPLLAKNKLYFVFESTMGSGGLEGLNRIFRPSHFIKLCQVIKSKWVGVCFDFEHVLSQNVDPKKDIEDIPYGAANLLKVCHLGFPTPHPTAHMPIPLGSKQQLWLYERLFELRKKGFKDGYLIFERGSAPRDQSLLALRIIKEFLEKDVEPKDLPLEFYGMKPGGPDVKRQEVAVRDHFMDPLKGMLAVPEEEYTFLGKTATDRGKAEVWKKEKYK